MSEYRTTALAKKLPSTVPFVGPEAQERAQERAFRVRIGANESVFGPSPQVKKAINAAAVRCCGGRTDIFLSGSRQIND